VNISVCCVTLLHEDGKRKARRALSAAAVTMDDRDDRNTARLGERTASRNSVSQSCLAAFTDEAATEARSTTSGPATLASPNR